MALLLNLSRPGCFLVYVKQNVTYCAISSLHIYQSEDILANKAKLVDWD